MLRYVCVGVCVSLNSFSCVCVYMIMCVYIIGYAKRQCLVGGVWGEVDKRDCVSVRAQQFLYDAESLEAQQVMHIHQLLYSLSEVTSFTVSGVGSVSGGDLSAVARYLSEVVSLQVDSAHSPVSGGSHQLLEVCLSDILHIYTATSPRSPCVCAENRQGQTNVKVLCIHNYVSA